MFLTSEREVRASAASLFAASEVFTGPERGCWHAGVKKVAGVDRVAINGWATGKGVVMGFTDTGIDVSYPGFFHFKLVNGEPVFETRILAYWDHYKKPRNTADRQRVVELVPSITDLNDAYGRIYLASDIEAWLRRRFFEVGSYSSDKSLRIHPSPDVYGHGTSVTAIAASHELPHSGSGLGIAPEAKIVAIKHLAGCGSITRPTRSGVSNDQNEVDRATESFDFFRHVADTFGDAGVDTPLVINQSWGQRARLPYHNVDITRQHTTRPFLEKRPNGAIFVRPAGNSGCIGQQGLITWGGIAPGPLQTFEVAVPFNVRDRRRTTLFPRRSCRWSREHRRVNHAATFTTLIEQSLSARSETVDVTARDGTATTRTFATKGSFVRVLNGDGSPVEFRSETSGDRLTKLADPGDYVGRLALRGRRRLRVELEIRHVEPELTHPGDKLEFITVNIRDRGPETTRTRRTQILRNDVPFYVVLETPGLRSTVINTDANKAGGDDQNLNLGVLLDDGLKLLGDFRDGRFALDDPPDGFAFVQLSRNRRHRITAFAANPDEICVGGSVLGDPATSAPFSSPGPVFRFWPDVTLPPTPAVAAPAAQVPVPIVNGGRPSARWQVPPSGMEARPEFASVKHKKIGGTSVAGPVVAGIIALMMEHRPKLTQEEAITFLMETVDQELLKALGSDQDALIEHEALFGAGCARAFEAVKRAKDAP